MMMAAKSRTKASGERITHARSGMLPRVYITESYQRTNNPMWVFATKLNQGVITQDDFATDFLAASDESKIQAASPAMGVYSAVTLTVAKRKGTNAITIANRILARMENASKHIIPDNIHMTVTRQYGETAKEKSNELLFHMLIAVLSVTLLIWFTLGRRVHLSCQRLLLKYMAPQANSGPILQAKYLGFLKALRVL